MRFTTRQLVLIAVFGALWGAVEITLGSVLKGMHIPLGGAVMAGTGLVIALVGRVFVPKPGSTLFIGIIAMCLKMFSIGSFIMGPMVGIIAEAVLAEAVLTTFRRPSRPAFLAAGGLAVLWTLAQPFFTGLLLFGRDMFAVWLDMLDTGSRLLGLDANAAFWVVLALVVLHLLIGGVAGWVAWNVGCALRTRLTGMHTVEDV